MGRIVLRERFVPRVLKLSVQGRWLYSVRSSANRSTAGSSLNLANRTTDERCVVSTWYVSSWKSQGTIRDECGERRFRGLLPSWRPISEWIGQQFRVQVPYQHLPLAACWSARLCRGTSPSKVVIALQVP